MNQDVAALPEAARLMACLCEIPSPSRHEQAIAEAVKAELADLGMEISEDDAGERIPAGCNNITARLAPTAEGTPLLFCAHLDTVPVDGDIEVVLTEDGNLTNANPTILGADNKAAVAAMLTAVRRIVTEGHPHAGIELLFTPCEELSLLGATAYDASGLQGELGFVYDSTGEIGDIVTSSPSCTRIAATFVGRPAHAGICPEEGRSAIVAASAAVMAMQLGRIDEGTTANVGLVEGGDAVNVVPAECTITCETRSSDPETHETQITAMLDAITWAATEHECDVEIRVDPKYHGYVLKATDPAVVAAEAAFTRLGIPTRHVHSGGGADVNALRVKGVTCVNLCNEMREIHTADEFITPEAVEAMVDVTLALVEGALGQRI